MSKSIQSSYASGSQAPRSGERIAFRGIPRVTTTSNSTAHSNSKKKIPTILVLVVGFGCLLLWQGGRNPSYYYPKQDSSYSHLDLPNVVSSLYGGPGSNDVAGPLGVPPGEAVALPNLHQVDSRIEKKRVDSHYGGQGDSSHLGGFANEDRIDAHGLSPMVWKNMVTDYNIKSVLDIGCGRAFATSWFWTHGLRTRGVDGSSDAIRTSAIPEENRSQLLVEHDFSLGPWWPAETYDAVWAVEFMEHVGINYMKNHLPAMRKAALIFMTTSRWGGWHHVEVHPDTWWIRKFESFGFRYSDELTNQIRSWAKAENSAKIPFPFTTQSDRQYTPQHIWLSMKVFINPVVASLPEHDHLFFQPGCWDGRVDGEIKNRLCGESDGSEESKVPSSYLPLPLTLEQDQVWTNLVQKALGLKLTEVKDSVLPNNSNKVVAQPQKLPESSLSARDLPKQELPEILQRIQQRNFTNMPQIPVLAWPYVTSGVQTAEHKHIEENGIHESPRLRMSKNLKDFDPNMVWIGDTGYGGGWNFWCGEFIKVIKEAMQQRLDLKLPPRWPIVIVDFTDGATLQRCPDIENLMGREYVRYTTRSVGKRHWEPSKNWVDFGYRVNTTMRDGLTYLHSPLVVRTDTVESIKKALESRGLPLTHPIERLPRNTDVIHLWPLNSTKVNLQFALLRNRVSEIIIDMGKRHSNIKTYVGLAGKPLREGRRGVEDAYIDMLLDTKIVVLAQRDQWEDHYRLMEALVSGACVFTDFMHGLPAGLQNGTSIIEYTTPQDLEQLILYYLSHDEERIEIGRKGREIAMVRHRTWHRIEEAVFGEIITSCESKGPGGNCPYIVHGDEKR